MKLALSNIAWPASMDLQVYRLMKKYGYTGLEIAPTRIFVQNPYDKLAEAKKWADNLEKDNGFVIPSMQSIWYGRQERIFGTEEEREVLKKYTKKAIDFASEIGCKNLVFGCPRNRNMPEKTEQNIAVDFFKELGDYAYEKGTVIGMEANPPIYNTNYINDTAAALKLIRSIDSKGFLLNLDVGTMIQNKENVLELEGQVQYINHVHISEPMLKPIEERDIHRQLYELLLKDGYQGFVSVEMGKIEDIAVIEDKIRYVQDIFG